MEQESILASRYDPAGIENRIYQRWLDRGDFGADADSPLVPYVIAIPPPNVTAALHMGHGLNNTIQDVLIRFERMRGRNALWVPGTDHAGIATQNVVERVLAAEGLSRFDLGREKFVERMWEWVHEYDGRITDQLQKIGASCDWDRVRFTLDEGLSAAVRKVFVELYAKGLIYRGNYIINWCPRCGTALSNEEVDHRDEPGHLYHIRYPLVDASDKEAVVVVVATTRPETMLGDTAVAVNPEDERYHDLIGREIDLPLVGRRIPIVRDEFVDPEFGTGLVKVTPAHDPNDFEIGQRHSLEQVNILNEDATLGDGAPAAYQGLDRFEARERVLEDLERLGLLEKTEDHLHSVGHCYRCDTIVEPRLSLQWFVSMKPLAEPALAAYREGRLRLHPTRFGNTYEHWLVNVRDWCISRQLWWGHRIPAWHCADCEHIVVAMEEPPDCPECGGTLEQDPDVLDTWFSSWLWPFSTLGWPDDTADLATFYPTSTLSTAPEILFFWVARMVMAGIEFMGDVPFTDVLLHGTVRDASGRRMSKSLGNGIDPLEVVNLYGADAMRFTLVHSAGLGTDLQLDHQDLETAFRVGRNFANKIWNAVRFALPYLAETDGTAPAPERLELADRWILSRYARARDAITDSLERFRLHDAAAEVYDFVWNEFCDWYLELVKLRLRGEHGPESAAVAASTLAFVLDGWLRLLQPIMPFITEELWMHLPGRDPESALILAPWPEKLEAWIDQTAEDDIGELKEVVGAIRNLRAEYGIDPGRRLAVHLGSPSPQLQRALAAESAGIMHLGRLSDLESGEIPDGEPGGHAVLRSGVEVFMPLRGVVDLERESERLGAEFHRLGELLEAAEARLRNPGFTERAPAEVVQRERDKAESLAERRELLLRKKAAFGPLAG